MSKTGKRRRQAFSNGCSARCRTDARSLTRPVELCREPRTDSDLRAGIPTGETTMSCPRPNAPGTRGALRLALLWLLAMTFAAEDAFALQPAPSYRSCDALPRVVDDGIADACGAERAPPQRDSGTATGALRFDETHRVTISGTRFEIAGPEGRALPPDALVGVSLSVVDAVGGRAKIRIDAVVPDPLDRDAEVTLYALSVQDADASWRNLCTRGPDGLALGFPVSGIWTSDGTHERATGAFSITCT